MSGSPDEGASADLSALQAIAYGGGRMPLELIDRALELFPQTNFTNAYGLTETSSTIAVLGPDDHRVADAATGEARQAPARQALGEARRAGNRAGYGSGW